MDNKQGPTVQYKEVCSILYPEGVIIIPDKIPDHTHNYFTSQMPLAGIPEETTKFQNFCHP